MENSKESRLPFGKIRSDICGVRKQKQLSDLRRVS